MLTPALAVKQFSFKPGGMALMLAQVISTLHADQGHGFRVCASPGAIARAIAQPFCASLKEDLVQAWSVRLTS